MTAAAVSASRKKSSFEPLRAPPPTAAILCVVAGEASVRLVRELLPLTAVFAGPEPTFFCFPCRADSNGDDGEGEGSDDDDLDIDDARREDFDFEDFDGFADEGDFDDLDFERFNAADGRGCDDEEDLEDLGVAVLL